jgi:isocitrate dehydrogenase (NAD+)
MPNHLTRGSFLATHRHATAAVLRCRRPLRLSPQAHPTRRSVSASVILSLSDKDRQRTSTSATAQNSTTPFLLRNASQPSFRQARNLPIQYDAAMPHKVTLIPGEGIGPEVAAAVKRILEATGVQIDWEELEARTDKATEAGQLVNQAAVESVRRNHVALKGPMGTAIAGGAPSVNVALRKTLDLYANLRPVKNLPGVKSRFENVDIVLVRENTEDLYSGLEHEVVPGVVESLKIITERASTRIAKFAFEYARKNNRKKIHAIHKANIMKLSDGLFLKSIRAVAPHYPEIEYKEMIVDNACMQMVLDPDQFDMLLLPNLYGDVMSDLAAGLVGGLGVVPSGNIGDGCAMFEAVHGTAPDIAGKGLANPTALLLSSVMMLKHLGERPAAASVESALEKVYREGKQVTRDVGGTANTKEFTDAVIAALAPVPASR